MHRYRTFVKRCCELLRWSSNTKTITAFILSLFFSAALFVSAATAAPVLEIRPITWNIIGLDSNSPTSGPYRFPIGARICNTGDTNAGNVTASFIWDDGQGVFVGDANADPYINLRAGSLSSVAIGTLTAGTCSDAYFEVEVAKVAAAFDKTRRYHITATDSVSGATGSSPQPRELYVEHLISQNRNSITDIKLNGVSVPAGGSMTLMVGNTYTISLYGGTATQGYEQFEAFINFPNTIFQILSVSTDYSANTSIYVDDPNNKLYADACLWENDPNNPNYRSCVGVAGKTGGSNVVTTYVVKILSGGGTSQTLNSLLYDFSGSSFHYNADYGVGSRIVNIVGPSSVTIAKSFSPKAIAPGGTSVMTFKLANPTTETFTGVNFTDTFPSNLQVANPTGVTYNGCGPGAFSPVPLPNDTSLSFSNGMLTPNSICTITVSVTAPAGTYLNTTSTLKINGTTDTGNSGSDTLTASSAPGCVPGQTLVTWTVPVGSANPPDTATGGAGSPTINNTGLTASSSAGVPGSTQIDNIGFNDTRSWLTYGYDSENNYVQFVVDTRAYTGVQMSFQLKNASVANGPTTMTVSYNNGAGFVTLPAGTLTVPANTDWTPKTIDFSGLTSTSGTTTFRIAASGAKNNNSGAGLNYDVVTFAGCGIPTPPPTISKSFSLDPVVKGTNSTLSFTINNTQPGNKNLTGIAFTDVLPAGLSISDSVSSVCGGTNNLSTTAATRTIALTGGALTAGTSCFINIAVTGTTEGQYDNVSGFISSTQSGTSTNYATDSLTVIAPPAIEKSFSQTSILVGGTSTLAFTITNPNQLTPLNGIGFTDTLPAGVTTTNGTTNSLCGSGSLVITGGNLLTFTGGSLSANSSCTFSVQVTGTTIGTKNNTTSAVTSTEGGNGNAASATLIVSNPQPLIGLNKQISTDNTNWFKYVGLIIPDDVYYRFTVTNDGETVLSTVNVTDPDVTPCALPASLAIGASVSCVVGPVAIASTPIPNPFINTATADSAETNPVTSSARYGTKSLTIDKSADKSEFTAVGELLTYSYLIENNGGYPLLGPVDVDDNKSADETCPAVNTVGDLDNYLDPGESITCAATYTVLAQDVTAGFVTNTAAASADGAISNTDSVTVIKPNPALSIVKSASPATYGAVGAVISYSYLVTNSGNVTLNAPFSVSDNKTTNESCPATPTLAPGASITCTSSYTITQADLDSGSVTNIASATNGAVTSPTDTKTVTAVQAPALTIVKSASPSTYSAVGAVINYSYLVTNSGNITLSGPFSVSDNRTTNESCPATPNLAPGASITCTSSYTITQADINSGSVTNIASATNGPVTSPTDTKTVTAVQAPALTIVKSAIPSTYSAVGAVISYSYLVNNSGNVTLSGPFTVSDNKTTNESCPATPTLAPGASITCTSSYMITQADINSGSVTNIASATNGAVTSPTDTKTVTAVQTPGLLLTKIGVLDITVIDPDYSADVGDVIDYTLQATNNGNVTLTNVSISDPLLGTLTCAQPVTLAPGATLTCTGSYTLLQDDLDVHKVDNTASVDSDQTTPTQTSHTVPLPEITLSKTATPHLSSPAIVGDTIDYEIVATNNGEVTLKDVSISDLLLGTLSCIPAQPAVLAPSDTLTCTGSYTISQADIDAGKVDNVAETLSKLPDDSDGPRKTAGASVVLSGSHALTIVKSAIPSTYSAVGAVISYSYLVTNSGNVTLSGPFSVIDNRTTNESCPATPTLAPGASITCTSSYTITQADLDSGSVTNIASATNGVVTSPTDTETVTAVQAPALTIVKSATPSTYSTVGAVISYSYLLTNSGNVTLSGPFTVSDNKTTNESCPATPTLAPGASITCASSYTITQADLDSGSVTNIASATNGAVTSPTDTETITAVQTPALTIVKSASPSSYSAVGAVISYSYLVTNSGNVTLNGPFSVSDNKTTNESCPATPTLAPGASITCTSSYTITQADLDAGSVTNTASTTNGVVTSPTDTKTVTAVQAPALTIVKSAIPSTYSAVGTVISYSYLVTNSGNITLSGPFSVSDNKTTNESCPATPTLSPGASITCTSSYTITQADINSGSVTNIASATNGVVTSPTDTKTVTAVQAPALTIVKSAIPSTYSSVGAVISYSYLVTNSGNVTLSGPFSVGDDKTTNESCPPTASLFPGASITCTSSYTITLADLNAGSVTNIASATNGVVTSPTDTETVTAGEPSVFDPPSGFKTVNAAGYPELVWRMVWINNGNADAVAVVITDSIPANTTYVAGSLACAPQGVSQTDQCYYDSGNNRIVWQGTIAADPGALNESQALNEVVIQLRTTMPTSITRVQNQGCAQIPGGDTSCTDDPGTPSSGDPTVWTKSTQPVAVPTMNEWGMIILLVLQGMGALYYMRRRARS